MRYIPRMSLATPEQNKEIYRTLHDSIRAKRFQAPSPIRHHAHNRQYKMFLDRIPAGATVLDAGCGEGMLSVMLAQKGCIVTGYDISEPNIDACKDYAQEEGVGEKITFLVGDIEHLPVPDKSFDYVVSSHVLEHIPDFVQGVRELNRVASKGAIAAIPTCLNPCAMVLLGHDKYWTFSRKSPYAIFLGFFKVVWALITGQEGVNEGYMGMPELIHIWRFPWRGRQLLEQGGLTVKSYTATAYILPYLPFLLPLTRFMEKFASLPVLRNFGYGTTYVCETH
jgi:ubiquinone/menaquinone biosynthesis C-methylase UbiE